MVLYAMPSGIRTASTSEFSSWRILQLVAGCVPCPLQGKEIVACLVFRLDEEQAGLSGLQVCALIRAHRPFVSEPAPVDPGSGRIWILTPKLARDLHNGENLIERLAGDNPHPLAFSMMREHLRKPDHIRQGLILGLAPAVAQNPVTRCRVPTKILPITLRQIRTPRFFHGTSGKT